MLVILNKILVHFTTLLYVPFFTLSLPNQYWCKVLNINIIDLKLNIFGNSYKLIMKNPLFLRSLYQETSGNFSIVFALQIFRFRKVVGGY